MPVTSPIAHRPSATRIRASTGTPRGFGSTPTVSRPMSVTRGRRPVATSSRSPRTSRPSSSSSTNSSASRRARVALADSTSSTPSRRSASPSASPSGAGSRARTCAPVSTTTASPPRRRTTWAISTPTGPAPRTTRRRGTAFIEVASRLVHTPSSSRRPWNRRHHRVRSVGEDDVVGGVPGAVDVHLPAPASRPVPAQQRDAGVGQPLLLPGIGVVGDHEVTPGERRLDVDLGRRQRVAGRVHGLAGSQQRLRRDAGVVGALTTDQLALDDGDPQAPLGQRSSAVLARRASTDHDHIEIAHPGSSSTAARGRSASDASSTRQSPIVPLEAPLVDGARTVGSRRSWQPVPSRADARHWPIWPVPGIRGSVSTAGCQIPDQNDTWCLDANSVSTRGRASPGT